MNIEEAENRCAQARQVYADHMDHVAKFARADCDKVRSGLAPDELAGVVLDNAVQLFYRWMKADRALRAMREF